MTPLEVSEIAENWSAALTPVCGAIAFIVLEIFKKKILSIVTKM
jgi:hypothetical protein